MSKRFMTTYCPPPRGDFRAEMRLLGSVPSFTDAPGAVLAALVEAGHVVMIKPGWALLHEHTAPEKAYVLLDGDVEVHRGGVDLGRCRPGEILGELGIVHRRLRTATVVTRSEATVLHLSREAFELLHDTQPYFRALVGEAVLRKSA
ncbi:MAG: putative transcriptional regulator, Crp/Fnr family [Marmoricola sp.]|nr:putative transcriptional regulator, Crp/Fnr family [Marmoricola sp.]